MPECTDLDLFDQWEELPSNILAILSKYEQGVEELIDPYLLCRNLIEELEQNGYTADYGLDGIPFGLKILV